MKHCSFILLLFVLLGNTLLSAQNGQGNPKTIFDSLQEPGAGKGSVVIHQSDAIRNLVGSRHFGANVEETEGAYFLTLDGFRAQIFSGNSQRTSKQEAFNKEKQVKEIFPDITTYVTYNAPFWRLRVGDFRTHDEAYHMLRQLKEAFPSYGKEMYIVPEKIKIPLH